MNCVPEVNFPVLVEGGGKMVGDLELYDLGLGRDLEVAGAG
jgi:hypothetical protein